MNGQTYLTTQDELIKACTILFGHDINISREFLFYIQPSGVKSAYRRRALETHPDAALQKVEEDSGPGADLFIETNWAYKHLLDFIKHRDKGTPRPFGQATNRVRPKRRPRHGTQEARDQNNWNQSRRGSFYRGKLPPKKLLFGQFLFYSGEVSWEALIKAIVWQRNQRPRIGELAMRWGWVTSEDIRQAMEGRELGEPLGEALVRLNLVSSAQLAAILSKQRSLQVPFGEYFVKNNLITKARLNQLARDFRKHNFSNKKGFNAYCNF